MKRLRVKPAAPSMPSQFLRPGSDTARRGGCTCSMIKNFYGRGFGDSNNPHFEIAADCQVHVATGATGSVRRG